MSYSYYGYPPKPPIIIQQRTWTYTCVICGLPGEAPCPSANAHPGECKRKRVEQEQARGRARRKQRAEAQRAGTR